MNEFYTHDIDPFIIHFPFGWHIGPIEGIPWYGTMYALGFMLGIYLLNKLREENFAPFETKKHVEDFILSYIILGVLLGGRAGHIFFYQIDIILDNPLRFFAVWEGGMASHGGMIGVGIAIILYCKKKGLKFTQISDPICMIATPALAFGRIANFINGEMPGKFSTVSWAVIFPKYGTEPRHPVQIYQALGEGLFLYLMLWFVLPRDKFKTGFISSMFLILYGIQRIITESFREVSETLASNTSSLTQGQTLSIIMILIGISLLWFTQKRTEIAS